jgi:hypothetical protein
MKTFETAQTDSLSKLRDSLLQYTKQQQQALESAQEGYRGMDKSLSGFKQVTYFSLLLVHIYYYTVKYVHF